MLIDMVLLNGLFGSVCVKFKFLILWLAVEFCVNAAFFSSLINLELPLLLMHKSNFILLLLR